MSNVIVIDPIADMITRIRNAVAVRKSEISLPHSNAKTAVAELLKATNFIAGVQISGEKTDKTLTLKLNEERSNAHITEITRLSKPGRRQYVSAQEVPTVKQGRGIVIISTSKGLMTGAEAKAQNVGGELICKVY